MIKITKQEAEVFRKETPQMHIAIVNRHKPYKGYFIEENKTTMAILRRLRNPKGSSQKRR